MEAAPANPIRRPALLYAAFIAAAIVAALAIYWPALSGPFFSDDVMYIVQNEYVQRLDARNLKAILDPWGAPGKMTMNYAPVHLLTHSLEFQAFQGWMPGYHVVNLLLHCVVTGLLILLLIRSGLPVWGAIGGGAFFLVHPANVEAVAWVSQLKSTAGLAFAMLALVLLPRRPGWSVLAFGLAILTKALTAFALPVALLFEWVRRAEGSNDEQEERANRNRRTLALVMWVLIFICYIAVEIPVFRYTNANVAPIGEDALGMARGMIAIAGRYLAMAATGWGVGAFQEAPDASSWTSPWVVLALPLLALLTIRLVFCTRERREEAVYWWWALISFGPVSQLFPFLYPIADRYLYFILPGLIGGVALAVASARPGRWLAEAANVTPRRCAVAVFALWLAFFAVRSHERAALWAEPLRLDREAMRNHPEGLMARLERAREAATRGDVDTVVANLRYASDRGQIDFTNYQRDPVWDPVRSDPRFREVVQGMARRWLALAPLYQRPSQVELRGLAHAHLVVGELAEAEQLLERALEVGGLRDAQVRKELVAVRVRLQRQQKANAAANGQGEATRDGAPR